METERPFAPPLPLVAAHRTDAFECGQASQNQYLQRFSWQNQQANAARTYVAARPLVFCWRVARVLEQQGSDEAMNYWRQAHNTLTAMVEQGLFVSPPDMQFLDTLRAKVDR